MRRVEAFVDAAESGRGELVAAERQQVARGGHDAGVGGGHKGEQGGNADGDFSGRAEENSRAVGNRRERGVKGIIGQHAAGHPDHERIENGGNGQREYHALRNGFAGVGDIFSDAGDLDDAAVGDKHKGGGEQDGVRPVGHER